MLLSFADGGRNLLLQPQAEDHTPSTDFSDGRFAEEKADRISARREANWEEFLVRPISDAMGFLQRIWRIWGS